MKQNALTAVNKQVLNLENAKIKMFFIFRHPRCRTGHKPHDYNDSSSSQGAGVFGELPTPWAHAMPATLFVVRTYVRTYIRTYVCMYVRTVRTYVGTYVLERSESSEASRAKRVQFVRTYEQFVPTGGS